MAFVLASHGNPEHPPLEFLQGIRMFMFAFMELIVLLIIVLIVVIAIRPPRK